MLIVFDSCSTVGLMMVGIRLARQWTGRTLAIVMDKDGQAWSGDDDDGHARESKAGGWIAELLTPNERHGAD